MKTVKLGMTIIWPMGFIWTTTAPAAGPLRVHPTNLRYFTDGSGRAVYLTGSHTWGSLQDGGVVDPPPAFDFTAYLDFLAKHQHNFIRLWRAEPTRASWDNHPARYYTPHPWPNSGPGNTLDGKPKFDKYDFRKNPPACDGRKVILLDTDHLWGIGGDRTWVWKSFLRGYNPIWMDPFDRSRNGTSTPWGPVLPADADEVRRNLGYTCGYAKNLNLAAMTPFTDLASSAYCLASPGNEYLVYLPEGREVTVDLSATAKALIVEWFDPKSGAMQRGATVTGGMRRSFHAPFDNDAVLYLKLTDVKNEQP
jgi:hypothetical protein